MLSNVILFALCVLGITFIGMVDGVQSCLPSEMPCPSSSGSPFCCTRCRSGGIVGLDVLLGGGGSTQGRVQSCSSGERSCRSNSGSPLCCTDCTLHGLVGLDALFG